MLTSGLRESSQDDPIEIQTVDPRAAELLIKYIYCGEIQLDDQLVEHVLYAADLFDIPEAVNLCCKFLLRSLTPYNSLYTLRLGDMHNNQELYNAALTVVSSQFTEVVKSVDFISAPPNQAIDLLSSDDLNVKTEIIVLQGALAWLEHCDLLRDCKPVPSGDSMETSTDQENEIVEAVKPLTAGEERIRREMLATVRYPLLPRSYLEGLGDDIVTLVCRDQLKDALRERKSLPELRRPVTLRKGMHYNKIYIAGGAGSSLAELSHPKLKMEMFDPVQDEWVKQPEPDFMSTTPHVGSLACMEDYLYVIGGSDNSGKPKKLVHRLNIVTGVWEAVSPLITSTTKPGVCVTYRGIYVGGGWDGTSTQSTFERYEASTGMWKKLRSMNRSRMEFPMISCAGKIYSICGNTSDYSNVAQSLEVYDPVDNGWVELQPTIRPRWCPGAAAIKDFIFICGLPGKDRAGLRQADKMYTVERFSPATGQWNIMPALSNPVGGACLVNVQDILYVLGGSDGTAPLASCSTAQRYDADAQAWKSIPPMYLARVGASVAVTGVKLERS
ncbi:kelch-like protein 20 isoform X2 [Bolinopsis microptera]